MNHAYRIVFNRALGVWQVVAEPAGSQGTGRSTGHRLHGGVRLLILLPLSAWASLTWAADLPGGGSVVRGQAAIAQSGSHMQVSQTSKNAVVNWNDFSIGRGASVHFNNANGATLNRVTGSLPSAIDGTLSASGALYLVNRNGVIVGTEGAVNAAGFMATTLDVRDDDFMGDGGLRFSGDSRAGIINLGKIQADSGNVALVAHSVRNDGVITAPKGSAELLAGQDVFLASPDAPALLVSLGEGAASAGEAGVTNTGLIEAAQARMQAANGNLYALAINQSGVVRATGVDTKGGRIVLTADGGTVRQDGQLAARNADGSGGEILVGGDRQGKNAAVAKASRTEVTAKARMDASAAADKGDGGRVIVWAEDRTTFAGRITARGGEKGGDGGFVEVSGKRTLDFRPAAPIDLSAPKGRTGTVLLDPDEIDVVGTVTGSNQIAAATVEAGLASANYVLDTSNFDPESGSGTITVSSDLGWSTASTLTLKSGNAIEINANITAGNGALDMQAGRHAKAPGETDLDDVNGGARLSAGNTIEVNTLRYGANADSLPSGYTLDGDPGTASFEADGTLKANTLELDLAGGGTGLIAENSQNAIGAFRTTGTGNVGYVSMVDGEGDLAVRLNSTNSSSNGVSVVTAGSLTLEAGSDLSFAPGHFVPSVVLAASGGEFINQAGSGALGGNLRYLIYTGTHAGTAKGGLTGTDEFSRSYTGNPPDDYDGDTTSRFLYRAASSPGSKELTYRANDLTRLYGDANPLLTYSVSGLQGGDVLFNVVSGTPLMFTSATMQSGVGQYAITISQGTLASSEYGFLFVPGTLTVNAAPLTLDIANASRAYGALNPAFTASVSGLKAGDSAADILAGWGLSTSATRASGVGGYAIDANWLGTGSGNYIYTVNPGTLTISPTPVTLTLAPTSMRYGDALPDFLAAATLSGTHNGDSVASAFPTGLFSTAATQGSPVGTYAVSASGFSNPNYVLSIGSLGSLTINKAPLVINANNASRLYGDANPAFSVASVTGWKNGDTLASIPGLVLTSAATGGSNVGSHAIVPAGSAANYEFVAGTGTLTISKAPVDVFLNATTRYYGDSDPLFTATYAGLKNGETALPGLSPVSNTNQYTPVGNYVISAGGTTTFQNYLPTFHAGVLTVAPRPLLVTANETTRVYGGDDPVFSVRIENATSWDAAQATKFWVATGTTATRQSDVDDYAIDVVTNPYGEQFGNLSNYAVTVVPGVLSITRAPLYVWLQPTAPIYWGDEVRPDFRLTGLQPWDTAATAGGVKLTYAGGSLAAPPGTYAVELASDMIGKNYQAVTVGSQNVRVLRRPIVITGDDFTTSTIAGLQDAHPGQIQPFEITRTDSNGNPITLWSSAPIAGGPQFTAQTRSDGTRGQNLASYVTQPYIQPVEGVGMADVLRYYDPSFVPGSAQVNPLANNAVLIEQAANETIINRNWAPSQPGEIIIDKQEIHVAPMWSGGGKLPSIDFWLETVASTNDALIAILGDYRGYDEMVGLAIESWRVNSPYLQLIDQNEAKIQVLMARRPPPADLDAQLAALNQEIDLLKTKLVEFSNFDAWTGKTVKFTNGLDVIRADPARYISWVGLNKAITTAYQNGSLSPQLRQAIIDKAISDTNAKHAAQVATLRSELQHLEELEERRLASIGPVQAAMTFLSYRDQMAILQRQIDALQPISSLSELSQQQAASLIPQAIQSLVEAALPPKR